jgi:G3E family GTPase
MRLLIVAGFLGSGKTTLVIKLAQAAAQKKLRSAILVNEIGEVGIDDQLMRQLDLNVWELAGGCICCTLSAGLLRDLHKLDCDYDPDLVVLETTGAARPADVVDALRYYQGRPLQEVRTVVLVDPLRLTKAAKIIGPLIQSQIAPADVLLVNKADLATAAQIAETEGYLQTINATAPMVRTSAIAGIEPAVLEKVLPWLN